MKILTLALMLIGSQITIHNHDCTVTRAWEDGSSIAHCENHTTFAYDPLSHAWGHTQKPPRNHYGH